MNLSKKVSYLILCVLITPAVVKASSSLEAVELINSYSTTIGDMALFPGYFGPLVSHDNQNPKAGLPGSKAGWHLPSGRYRPGTGWWALVCDAKERLRDEKGCRLMRTRLFVAKAKHAVYDDKPVNSQLLHWSPLPDNLGKVPQENEIRPHLIAVFKPLRSLAALKLSAGYLKTYVHEGMTQYPRTDRPGTLEVRLSLGHERFADVVPRVNPVVPKDENRDIDPMALRDIATFELRMNNQRQQLPGYTVEEMDGQPIQNPQSYLLWAGDLDGDDKPDLILNHGGYGTHVALYLSSLAKKNELVGLAGSFQYADPSTAGC